MATTDIDTPTTEVLHPPRSAAEELEELWAFTHDERVAAMYAGELTQCWGRLSNCVKPAERVSRTDHVGERQRELPGLEHGWGPGRAPHPSSRVARCV